MNRTVEGRVNYTGAMTERPRYYANEHSRDVLALEERTIHVDDARMSAVAPSLEREGFVLIKHSSGVQEFRDAAAVAHTYPTEIEQLVVQLSGADRAVVTAPGVLRFSENSPDSGRLNNSLPARFIHIDISDPTAKAFADRSCPRDAGRRDSRTTRTGRRTSSSRTRPGPARGGEKEEPGRGRGPDARHGESPRP